MSPAKEKLFTYHSIFKSFVKSSFRRPEYQKSTPERIK
jgi:hypothetical protein